MHAGTQPPRKKQGLYSHSHSSGRNLASCTSGGNARLGLQALRRWTWKEMNSTQSGSKVALAGAPSRDPRHFLRCSLWPQSCGTDKRRKRPGNFGPLCRWETEKYHKCGCMSPSISASIATMFSREWRCAQIDAKLSLKGTYFRGVIASVLCSALCGPADRLEEEDPSRLAAARYP